MQLAYDQDGQKKKQQHNIANYMDIAACHDILIIYSYSEPLYADPHKYYVNFIPLFWT